jgi:hypothetical protein
VLAPARALIESPVAARLPGGELCGM